MLWRCGPQSDTVSPCGALGGTTAPGQAENLNSIIMKNRTSTGKGVRAAARKRRASSARPKQRAAALEVLKKFRQIFRAAKVHFREVERNAGVSGAQLWLLAELAEQPGARVKDLAAAMALHQSTVSNLLEALTRRKLLVRRRDEDDQRVVRVHLTAAGERLVRKAPGPARGVLPDALEALPPVALRRLDQSVAVLLKAMKVEVPAAAALTHLQDI
jgi:DNA-binding MarR family transcriptional regulator